jgi:two-component system, OmpR family, response regulator BaeR
MTPPRHVLVVEDDAKIAQLLLDYLRNEGFEASTVADGLLALSQIQAAPPALVILDLMLPVLNGVSVCRTVRKFSEVLTARIDEVDRLLGSNSGTDDYACKPFSSGEVMSRVRALVRRADWRNMTSAQS